jgi:hypothetical protein
VAFSTRIRAKRPGQPRSWAPVLVPVYEKLIESELPALLHCAGCYGRENYSEHFISEESLAILSISRSNVFSESPGSRSSFRTETGQL